MDIKAIKNKKYFKKSDEIYKNIMISSARARQIVDSRYQELVVEEDLESFCALVDCCCVVVLFFCLNDLGAGSRLNSASRISLGRPA